MPVSVRQVLSRRCGEGSGPVLFEGSSDRTLTWNQVAARVAGWQASEADHPGRRVGVAIGDPLSMAAEYLAALAAGVTIAPLNPEAAPGELAAQARALGLHAVLTDTDNTGRTDALAEAGCALWRPGPAGPAVWLEGAGSQRADLPGGAALIMFSSGTTGEPKVIPVSEAQLLHTASNVVGHLGLDAGQRGFSPLPLWHINGLVVGVLASAVGGASLVVERRFSRRGFWSSVARHRPTWCNLVPAMLSVLSNDDGGPPDDHRIRLVRSASAPLPAAVRERFERRFHIPIIETYGMTEAASQITANPLGERRPGSVGIACGVELRVVDAGNVVVAAGTEGHVQIRGAGVTGTYWAAAGRRPSRRPALGPGSWLPTGDVGRLDRDGYLWLVGRDDDVINRGGEKVQPREVEECLAADPRVLVAVVVARPHPTVGQEPVAYVVAHAGVAPAELAADLERRCTRTLSRYKRPATIQVLDAMPSGPTGKPRRGELRRLAALDDQTRRHQTPAFTTVNVG